MRTDHRQTGTRRSDAWQEYCASDELFEQAPDGRGRLGLFLHAPESREDRRADIIDFNPRERLARVFEQLESEIASSRSLLELEDGWDDDDAEAYSEETWLTATLFLRSFAQWLWREYGVKMLAPRILPGPDGSIDIRWKTPNRGLLLNIPKAPGDLATFYGDDSRGNCVKGEFDPKDPTQGALAWLVRIQ